MGFSPESPDMSPPIYGDGSDIFARTDDADETDLLMSAWGVIANVSGGDWTQQTAEWQEAAAIWRANFHMILTFRDAEL